LPVEAIAGGLADGCGGSRNTYAVQAEAGQNRGLAVSARKDGMVVWRQADGAPIACDEKIKVLNENLAEVRQTCRDALEDAVLMGCDAQQIRRILHAVIDSLDTPFA
jgi:hypothetical protein